MMKVRKAYLLLIILGGVCLFAVGWAAGSRRLPSSVEAPSVRALQAAPRPWVGPENATELIVYADLLCPSCVQLVLSLDDLAMAGRFHLLIKHLPGSQTSARLAIILEALGLQSPMKARSFLAWLSERGEGGSEADLKAWIRESGADANGLQASLAQAQAAINADIAEAGELGIVSAPTVVLGGKNLGVVQGADMGQLLTSQGGMGHGE